MSETPAQVAALVDGMQAAIRDFEEGRLSIDRLAWELKSRIAALHQVADAAWADELKAIWNQLEMTNALFIESGRKVLSDDELREAMDILNALRSMLIAY
jgi:DNA-binding MurR/RpiR family transcriptional regulator